MNKSIIITVLIFLIIGSLAGYFIRSVTYEDTSLSMQYIKGNTNLSFISQRLDSESVKETTQGQIVAMKNNITNFIEEVTGGGQITKIAVYYRDLNNGPWMGINEKEGFSPASLLKVPIMMAAFKLADSDRSFLSRKTVNQISSNGIIPDIVPIKQIQKGESYTIEDLVYRTIVYSDNDAKNLLLSQVSNNDLDQIYKDLGMAVPGIVTLDDFMTVRSYASFFRVLYNGSYLSRDLSNKALEMLSKSEFKDGLVAGVPGSLKVSHKFGERALGNGIKQLHDCGIVYNRDNPYVLCIMTRGSSWEKLTKAISGISKIVYEEVKN